jgi:hypothetical protein
LLFLALLFKNTLFPTIMIMMSLYNNNKHDSPQLKMLGFRSKKCLPITFVYNIIFNQNQKWIFTIVRNWIACEDNWTEQKMPFFIFKTEFKKLSSHDRASVIGLEPRLIMVFANIPKSLTLTSFATQTYLFRKYLISEIDLIVSSTKTIIVGWNMLCLITNKQI